MDREDRLFEGLHGSVRDRLGVDLDEATTSTFDSSTDHLGLAKVELSELSVGECLALLPSVRHGHLAVTHRALPAVIPVRVTVVDEEIIVTSLLGDAVPLRARSVVALGGGHPWPRTSR